MAVEQLKDDYCWWQFPCGDRAARKAGSWSRAKACRQLALKYLVESKDSLLAKHNIRELVVNLRLLSASTHTSPSWPSFLAKGS